MSDCWITCWIVERFNAKVGFTELGNFLKFLKIKKITDERFEKTEKQIVFQWGYLFLFI